MNRPERRRNKNYDTAVYHHDNHYHRKDTRAAHAASAYRGESAGAGFPFQGGAAAFPIPEESIAPGEQPSFQRIVKIDHKFKSNDRIKMKTLGMDSVMLNHDTIELRYVEQLADSEQLYALGCLVKYAQLQVFDGKKTLTEVVDILDQLLQEKGLAAVCGGSYVPSGLAMPRRQEIFACLNRYRGLKV